MVLYAVCLMEPMLVRHSPSLSNIMNSCYSVYYYFICTCNNLFWMIECLDTQCSIVLLNY